MKRSPIKRSTKPIARGKRPKQRRETPRRRPEGTYDEAYKAAVRALPCYQCGHPAPSEPDHMGARGYGQKAPDSTCVPMCRVCHRARTDGKLLVSVLARGRIHRYMEAVHKQYMAEFCKEAIAATRKALGYGERVEDGAL